MSVGIPLFSVTALLAVSAWITYEAISIIIDPSGSDDVNVYFLYGFAAANFLVDVICAVLFYLRRGDVLKTTIECDVSHSLMEVSCETFYCVFAIEIASCDRINTPRTMEQETALRKIPFQPRRQI